MRPRILLNLGVFALLAAIMFTWATVTLLPVHIGQRETKVEAQFITSPGLRDGLEVDYLGVAIGRVGTIRLEPGHVGVTLVITGGNSVPSNATAEVLRKSAIGEPYVELSPPNGPSAAPFSNGDVIPLTRTKGTVEYQQLFQSAGKMLSAADPADLKVMTHELAIGLNGQGGNLRDILANLNDVTGTLADNGDVLDALAVQLTALAGTLSDKRTQLASGINDLAAFTSTLDASRGNLDTILADAPGFLDQTQALLNASRPGLRCLLTAFGVTSTPVFTPQNAKTVTHALNNLTIGFPKVINDMTEHRPEGEYVRMRAVITVAGPVPNAALYPARLTGPATPPTYYCNAGTQTTRTTTQNGKVAADSLAPPGSKAAQVFQTTKPVAVAHTGDASGVWLRRLPWALGALVLLATAAHSVRRVRSLAPWRRR